MKFDVIRIFHATVWILNRITVMCVCQTWKERAYNFLHNNWTKKIYSSFLSLWILISIFYSSFNLLLTMYHEIWWSKIYKFIGRMHDFLLPSRSWVFGFIPGHILCFLTMVTYHFLHIIMCIYFFSVRIWESLIDCRQAKEYPWYGTVTID